MRKLVVRQFVGVLVVLALGAGVAACNGGTPESEFDASAPEDDASAGSSSSTGTFGSPTKVDVPDGADAATDSGPILDCDATPGACAPPGVCGDGKGGLGESCDDGNTTGGDGCSATCQVEAPYWACAFGVPCVDVRDCDALIDAGVASADGGCSSHTKPAVCGDGYIDPGEACDDGNVAPGDGCSLDCKVIEANYACPTPGALCVSTMICGDGQVTGTEQCDDGNTASTDGCSATCTLEAGWVCPVAGTACNAAACGDGLVAGAEECDDHGTADGDGCSATCKLQTTIVTVAPTTSTAGKTTVENWVCATPGQACTKTTCGDGVVEGTEQCDDGNTRNGDGCAPDCRWEARCPGGACVSRCGDGILFDFDADGVDGIDEECDDGNTRSGDGCSATCKKEVGYDCVAVAEDEPPYIDVPVVFRDFKYWSSQDNTSHPDFERYGCNVVTHNLTNDTLADGVPTFRYDGRGLDPVTGLDPNGYCGGSSNNDRSRQLTNATSLTDWYKDIVPPNAGGLRGQRFDDVQIRLTRSGTPGDYSYSFDSDVAEPYKTRGGFFPIDGRGWGNQGASHNFAFSTELRFAFTYDAGQSPQLTFSGDDDVWVFVNGKLALDLGGLHSRQQASFVLDGTKAATLGLVDGHVYEIALFHAERHTNASNFWLTLRGFVKKKSVCSNVCGDGIKTREEQCDRGGANTDSGAYGTCRLDCTLGPYCGDHTTTAPEECDDGTNLTSWTPAENASVCAPSCKAPAYCGDGKVQGAFGEQCDEGTAQNTGGYGKCKPNCTPGPRCGDGTVQAGDGEACDNGFNVTSYVKHPTANDCAPQCKTPRACGDGVVDYPFEQCDNGNANVSPNANAYNACTTECTLGPRCGDGVVQSGEQCDDGNRTNGDGCSAACLTESTGPNGPN